VGESWEISVEPSFLSRLDTGEALADAIAADPRAWLGQRGAEKYSAQLPLLVKIVDARDNLSVQVHPTLTSPGLAADESGKLESWTILDAEPGSGIYLGFRAGVDRAAVAACLERGEALDRLMNFIEVAPGETYVIRPGTPHAIGAGLTLVEPQLLVPGKKAVTYRFWDWNRTYDAEGRPSPAGKPRAMDVARSLEATDWGAARGEAFVEACRCARRTLHPGPVGRDAIVEEGDLQVEWWTGDGTFEVPPLGTSCGLTCVGGDLELEPSGFRLRAGESALVPAAIGGFRARLSHGSVIAARAAA
ncbi:MAG: class I mannose-6-phosphate isomerase, partial [Myxococcales bacterium]|nr:class I mannose-6-phosphate isomerase [Myxococcales bacterium]